MKKQFSRLCNSLVCMLLLGLSLVACNGNEADSFTIGVVNLSPRLDPVLAGFKEGMAELGYVEGENVTYIYQGPAPTIHDLDGIVAGLLAEDIDLIVAISTPATQAAYRATLDTDIPVVFGPVTDPVAANVVDSLAQPGGNLTGVALETESEKARLDWLMLIAPDIQRIYLPYNSDDASANSSVEAISEAAAAIHVTVVLQPARNEEEISAAIASIPDDVDAVMLPQDSLVAARIVDFAAATIERQLPLSTPTDGQVELGALVSYSFRLNALGKQMARLGDQILQGNAPADLPVETAEFFLTINLHTAEAIGLTVPNEVLQAAAAIVRE